MREGRQGSPPACRPSETDEASWHWGFRRQLGRCYLAVGRIAACQRPCAAIWYQHVCVKSFWSEPIPGPTCRGRQGSPAGEAHVAVSCKHELQLIRRDTVPHRPPLVQACGWQGSAHSPGAQHCAHARRQGRPVQTPAPDCGSGQARRTHPSSTGCCSPQPSGAPR